MGTSAGALSGSLFSAGYSPKQVEHSACGHPFTSQRADSIAPAEKPG